MNQIETREEPAEREARIVVLIDGDALVEHDVNVCVVVKPKMISSFGSDHLR